MRRNKSRTNSASHQLRVEHLESRQMLSCTPLTGDYSGNGIVGSEDYGLWKQSFGSTTELAADGNGDNVVDAADYTVWRNNLGATSPPGGSPCVNISIDGLGETVEEDPGAIIWRNSDFSKESLASAQPEAGEPLYEPDYLAPATLVDPNIGEDFTDAFLGIDPTMVGQYTVEFTFDANQIRLWTTTSWSGMTDVGGGRYQIETGTTLTPDTSSLNFDIEGLTGSTAFATDTIFVQANPTAGGPTIDDTGVYTVVETGIGADGNRDTQIEFDNSHDRQLLFWVNNDQEGFSESDPAVESEVVNITDPDHSDNLIDQRRDLEDLAPLRLQVDPLLFNNTQDVKLGAVPPGQLSARYSLNFLDADGESFRLFYANNFMADVYRHVNNETTAQVQATDPAFRSSERPAFTGNHILENVLSGLNPHLFEIRHGTLPYGSAFANTPTLTFVTEVFYPDGSSVEKRHDIQLDIRDIKSFYTNWDVPYLDGENDLRTDVSFQHFATPIAPTHESQIQSEPFFSGPDTIVHVHGWNMPTGVNNDWKAAFAETMFKRLYWQGYRGEFVSLDWPTFANEEGPNWPIFGEGANNTYNPSDFQAYRSAQALKDVLESYRGTAPNLQPVHLLAHSMGNIVAGEALRQWTFELPLNDAPLVTSYVAMQAAVSAGAYGNNDTDSRIAGRPVPDLYRFFQHGRDGFSDPSLGTVEYFQGAGFAAENRINFYNEDDFALNLWDINNFSKDLYLQSFLWPYDYEFTEGDGENINNDTFLRNPDVGPDVTLDLALPNGRPGSNAYEILAFFAQSASLALGTKPVAAFDSNFDLESLGMLGGSDSRPNHSYQFHHDAAETWGFYTRLKNDLGFDATYGLSSIVSPLSTAGEGIPVQEPLKWFVEPITVAAPLEHVYVEPPPVVPDAVLRSQRFAKIQAFFELYETGNRRLTERPPSSSHDISEALEIVFESLSRDEAQG